VSIYVKCEDTAHKHKHRPQSLYLVWLDLVLVDSDKVVVHKCETDMRKVPPGVFRVYRFAWPNHRIGLIVDRLRAAIAQSCILGCSATLYWNTNTRLKD